MRAIVENDKPANASSTVSPVANAESEQQVRYRAFAALLDQFDGKELERPAWPGCSRQQLLPIVVMDSIAVVMDAQGTSTIVPQGETRDILESGRYEFAFQVGNRDYRFRRGDFPMYEQYNALARAASARREAAEAVRLKSQTPLAIGPAETAYSEEFLDAASQFAHGALALLQ